MTTDNPKRLDDVELVREVGTSLHGREWRRPVARDVGVSGSLLAYVDSGQLALSPSLRRRLAAWAAREATAEVPRARRRVALLQELHHRFGDKI